MLEKYIILRMKASKLLSVVPLTVIYASTINFYLRISLAFTFQLKLEHGFYKTAIQGGRVPMEHGYT